MDFYIINGWALKFLQDSGFWHGDLDTTNIFFDDEYLIYRIYDNSLLNSPFEGFKKSC